MKTRGCGSTQVLVLLVTCALIAETYHDQVDTDDATRRHRRFYGCNSSSLEKFCDFPNKDTCDDNEHALLTLTQHRAKCCGVVHCSYQNTAPDNNCDSTVSVNITLMWYAINSYYADLLIQWTDSPSESSTTDGYQMWITNSLKDSGPSQFNFTGPLRCTCLPADTRNYRVRVSLSPIWYIHVKLVRLPSPVCVVNTDNATTESVPKCWDAVEASVDKCGVMRASAPQNLSVTSDKLNTSHLLLNVTWSPPEHYAPTIIKYRIRIMDMGVVEKVNGSMLQYSTIVGKVNTYNVQVEASSGEIPTEVCTDCWSEPASFQLNLTGISSTTSSTTFSVLTSLISGTGLTATLLTETLSPVPTHTSTIATISGVSTHTSTIATTSGILDDPGPHKVMFIVIIVPIAVTGLVLIISVILITAWCMHCKQQKYTSLSQFPICAINNDHELPVRSSSRSVFVVHSERCSEKHLILIRQLCHGLSDYSIRPVAFVYDEHAGPTQQGITQWTENNFVECDKVLIVCNKELSDDWSNKQETQSSSLVAAAKLAFHGCVNKDNKDLSKFAVVLLKHSDHRYIPGLLLQNPVRFVYPKCNSNEEIARFVHGIPKFEHPNNLHDANSH